MIDLLDDRQWDRLDFDDLGEYLRDPLERLHSGRHRLYGGYNTMLYLENRVINRKEFNDFVDMVNHQCGNLTKLYAASSSQRQNGHHKLKLLEAIK